MHATSKIGNELANRSFWKKKCKSNKIFATIVLSAGFVIWFIFSSMANKQRVNQAVKVAINTMAVIKKNPTKQQQNNNNITTITISAICEPMMYVGARYVYFSSYNVSDVKTNKLRS